MPDKKIKNQKSKIKMKKNFALFIASLFLLSAAHINAFAAETGHKHSPFSSIDEYIKRMEDTERVGWQMPEKVVDYLAIKNGDIVADIGAGSGYFTVLFSKRVGDSGKIFAVDIEKGMIEYLEKRAKREGFNNIDFILAKPDDPLLEKSSVDLIFICDTYHHIEKRDNYLKNLRGVLKKDGRLVIVDFHAVDTPVGPPLKMRMPKEKTLKEILSAGFKLEAEYFFLPYQYFLIFSN
jgi:ubiquinone/menaquinone biosynthesis C-methylase UbiE